MAALPYMQFYVADYLADTSHLTTEEHGAYMLLLFSYWQTGKPLRIDRLSTIARVPNERWHSVAETLSEFFHVTETHWIQFRVESDLDAVNSKTQAASNAGKASAKAKALKKQQELNESSTTVADPLQRNVNHIDTDTDTDTDTDKNIKSSSPSADDLFPKFWKLYPNKKGKAAAEKAWKKLKVTDDLFTLIAQGLAKQCASLAWTKDGGQFIPHPATWLNGKRWEDEVQPASNVHQFPQSRHTGFDTRDYKAGLTPRGDGTYDF
ncbi:YdaU family protein [Pseudomonas fragariae (ex Marin et al. 2024)]|uniref:YdaU family protein n=1 Tax=Pseudomonas fragariae (ex Marin et al. 2024) TaxID=3080056 RepID=UPI003F7AD973